jgi:hypothetical protein
LQQETITFGKLSYSLKKNDKRLKELNFNELQIYKQVGIFIEIIGYKSFLIHVY